MPCGWPFHNYIYFCNSKTLFTSKKSYLNQNIILSSIAVWSVGVLKYYPNVFSQTAAIIKLCLLFLSCYSEMSVGHKEINQVFLSHCLK